MAPTPCPGCAREGQVVVLFQGRRLAVSCPDHRTDALIAAQMIFGCSAEQARIRVEHRAECDARRRYWIGGIPTLADLAAVDKTIARRLRLPPEAVTAALAEDAATA